MSKTLNFNNLKKKYLTVTLADEKETTLMVITPTKALLDSFLAMKDAITENDRGDEALDELYGICAKLLSRNKTGTHISKEMLEDIFDFEDIIIFVTAYTNFIHEVTSAKN